MTNNHIADIPVDEVLRQPLTKYLDVFRTLNKKFRTKMWDVIVSSVSTDNYPMVILLLSLAKESLAKYVAREILKQHRSIIEEPFKSIITLISGKKIQITPELIRSISRIYLDKNMFLNVIKLIINRNTKNLDLNMLCQALSEKQELVITIASEFGIIHNLPKNILFAVADAYPDDFFNAISISIGLKIEYASYSIKIKPQSKQFIKRLLNDNPIALEPYLYYILSTCPDLIPHVINLGGNLTRISLYAILNVAQQQNLKPSELIKILKEFQETCPADIKSIINLIKKTMHASAVSKLIGPLDAKLLNYQPTVSYVEIRKLSSETIDDEIFLRADFAYISKLDLRQQVSYLQQIFKSPESISNINLLKYIFKFNLYTAFSRVISTFPNKSAKHVKIAIIDAIKNAFVDSGHEIDVLHVVREFLDDNDDEFREYVVRTIGLILNGSGYEIEALKQLLPLLNETSWRVREATVMAIGYIFKKTGSAGVLNLLKRLLHDSDNKIKLSAAEAIGLVFNGSGFEMNALSDLKEVLNYSDDLTTPYIIDAIAHVFEGTGVLNTLDAIKPYLDESYDSFVRIFAIGAIGNIFKGTGSWEAFNVLKSLLQDFDVIIRILTSEAIGLIFNGSGHELNAFNILMTLLRNTDDESIGFYAAKAIGFALKDSEFAIKALNLLKTNFDRTSNRLKERIANIIGFMFEGSGCIEAFNVLKTLLKYPDTNVKQAAINAIGSIFKKTGSMDIFEILTPFLKDRDSTIKDSTVDAISIIFSKSGHELVALSKLNQIVKESDEETKIAIIKAIGLIFEKAHSIDALDNLTQYLRDSSWRIRSTAIDAVGKIFEGSGSTDVLATLNPLLKDENTTVIISTIDAIGKVFNQTGEENILKLLEPFTSGSKDKSIRCHTIHAIGSIFENTGSIIALKFLSNLFNDSDECVINSVINAIGQIFKDSSNKAAALEALKSILKNKSIYVRNRISEEVGLTLSQVIGLIFENTNNKEALNILDSIMNDLNDIDDIFGTIAREVRLAVNKVKRRSYPTAIEEYFVEQ